MRLNGEDIDNVQQVMFLGFMVTTNGNSLTEIKKRLATAKTNVIKSNRDWEAKELNMGLKKTLVKTLIWSIALYACESWTQRKEEEKKIN